MNKINEQVTPCCGPTDTCCEVHVLDGLPLPMIMVHGWFNDQRECFTAFLETLTPDEQGELFEAESRHLQAVKKKYEHLWKDGSFRALAERRKGAHKRVKLLSYGRFAYWAACVSNAVSQSGSLKALLQSLGTVEAAHEKFKPWFARKTWRSYPRVLNAAGAARLIARYDYLRPERRPLLTRGALRGAAILLDEQPPSKDMDTLEQEYQDEEKRTALEEKAAKYIDHCEDFSHHGKWKMEKGEDWLCNVVHKVWYPQHS